MLQIILVGPVCTQCLGDDLHGMVCDFRHTKKVPLALHSSLIWEEQCLNFHC